ncbi:MAG: hypothetical protein IJ485_01075 [Lachnospiraceae bacterium]|nr:hypothetical protein [Lachnospiraceae bacterium]
MKNNRSGSRVFLCVLLCVCATVVYVYMMQAYRQEDAIATEVTKDYETKRIEAGLTEQAVRSYAREQSVYYSYQCLTEEEQMLYAEILMILTQMEQDMMLSTLDEKMIGTVFQCVLNDHPELFYVDGYELTRYTVGDELKRMTLTGAYSFTPEEVRSRKIQIEQYVSKCLNAIPQDASEYEKVKYIYEYLILHTQYRMDSKENQTICSVFLHGESVCQGYAKAMQYLCQRAGIETTLVVGTVHGGEGHAWNLVKIDGAYYYVDVTWGDAYYVFEAADTVVSEVDMGINYDYLCVTTEQIGKTHQIDNVVPMPRCVATEANYYVMEGVYFELADLQQAANLFAQAYMQKKETVTLKCADEAVYSEMKRLLIEEQQVFSYIQSGEMEIVYTKNDAQLTLSFWL